MEEDTTPATSAAELKNVLMKYVNILQFQQPSLIFIVFFGLPGSGKTMLAHAFSNHLITNTASTKKPYRFRNVPPHFFRSGTVGVAEANIAKLFTSITRDTDNRHILFIDELDNNFKSRNDPSVPEYMHSITTMFQTQIEGKFDSLVILGCSNYWSSIEGAVRRRVTEKYFIKSITFTPEKALQFILRPITKDQTTALFPSPEMANIYKEYFANMEIKFPSTVQGSAMQKWVDNSITYILSQDKIYINVIQNILYIADWKFSDSTETDIKNLLTDTFIQIPKIYFPSINALIEGAKRITLPTYAEYLGYIKSNNIILASKELQELTNNIEKEAVISVHQKSTNPTHNQRT